jgi:hypothetical protein
VVVVEENAMELFVMDRQMFEGDTIAQCSEADTVVLIVYSSAPWDVESESESGSESGWFAVRKINIYNAEIAFSENLTGAARSGSVAVRDSQSHVMNLVVYQSADCSGTSVAIAEGGSGVRYYPNPVAGRLVVDLDGGVFTGRVTLGLFDVMGRLVQEVRPGEVVGSAGVASGGSSGVSSGGSLGGSSGVSSGGSLGGSSTGSSGGSSGVGGVVYVDMEGFEAGVYFLRVADDAGRRVVVPVLKE